MKSVSVENVASVRLASSSVAYHLYSSVYSKAGSDDLICLFEGRDAPYYNIRIKKFTKKIIHPIKCGNKMNVLKLYEKLKAEKNRKEIQRLFFIDRDFDTLINQPEIYETCRYSIENYYCELTVFQEILKCEYGLNIGSEEYDKLTNLYEQLFNNYCNKIVYFNAWYRALKILKAKEHLDSVGFSLENKIPSALVQIDLNKIDGNYNIEDLKKIYPKAISCDEIDIEKNISILSSSSLSHSLRGKFLLYFLYKFLSCLNHNCKTEKKYIKKSMKFELQYNEAITKLSIYAVTPSSLETYLKKHLN